jgi:RND family efflux transporter MFP subunit
MSTENRVNDSETCPHKHEEDDPPSPAAEPVAPSATRSSIMRPRSLWILGACLLLPLAGGVAYGAVQHSARKQQAMRTLEQQQDLVPTVRVAKARAADSTMNISLPGTTLAFAAANIFARANGYIETRKVDIGDHVKAGDLLARITAPEQDHQVSQAEATLAQMQAQLQQTTASRDLAQVTNDRDTQLVKKGWVTPQQGDTDRLTLDAQNAAIAVAKSNIAAQSAFVQVLKQQQDYQKVVAPFDGIVTQRSVDAGSLVQSGSTLMFSLMQSDVIRTQVYVPQDAAIGVAPGVEAVVRVPEIPGRTFPGTVTRSARALAPGTRTLLTEVDIPNPDGALSPGMYVSVELRIPRKTQSIMVPADALVFGSDGLQVAVDDHGVARFHKVTVLRDLGTEAEVSDGIKPGDALILRPSVALADGSKVQQQSGTTQLSER